MQWCERACGRPLLDLLSPSDAVLVHKPRRSVLLFRCSYNFAPWSKESALQHALYRVQSKHRATVYSRSMRNQLGEGQGATPKSPPFQAFREAMSGMVLVPFQRLCLMLALCL